VVRGEGKPGGAQSIKLDRPTRFWEHGRVFARLRQLLTALLCSAALALSAMAAGESPAPPPVAELGVSDAIVLGVV
jgi:hypothetical protein